MSRDRVERNAGGGCRCRQSDEPERAERGGSVGTRLQGSVGNQAVQALAKRRGGDGRLGAEDGGPVAVGGPRAEREAERTAREVVDDAGRRDFGGRGGDRSSDGTRRPAPPAGRTASVRDGASGRPLPGTVRSFFEPRFGADFADVGVHTGEVAGSLTRALDARAFAYGSDVYFGEGAYRPGTEPGRRLIAHELTHVLQQGVRGSPRIQRQATSGQPRSLDQSLAPSLLADEALEREILLLREWLARQRQSSEETVRLREALVRLEAEARRRDSDVDEGGGAAWAGPPRPAALDQSIDPSMLTEAELDAEIAASRQYLAAHQVTSEETARVRETLAELERARGAGSVLEDAESFERAVLEAAKLQLRHNREALDEWKAYVDEQLGSHAGLRQVRISSIMQTIEQGRQTGGQPAVERWLRTRGEHERAVYREQVEGRYRACQGCHGVIRAQELDRRLEASRVPSLRERERSPLETLRDMETGGTRRADRSGDPRVHPSRTDPTAGAWATSAIGRAESTLERLGAADQLRPLGPERYDVLPEEVFTSRTSPSAVVAEVKRNIERRQASYRELEAKIDEGEVDYMLLRPIVGQLLPAAAPEVQAAVQAEIESAERWELVKNVVVAGASIGTLLLLVFPPTTALGAAGAATLTGALAAEQVYSGIQSYRERSTILLGRGAEVFSPEQQEAADALLGVGIVEAVMGAVDLFGVGKAGVKQIRLLRTGGGADDVGRLHGVTGEVDGGTVHVRGLETDNPTVRVVRSDGTVVASGPASAYVGGGSGGTPGPPGGAPGGGGSGRIPPARQLPDPTIPPSRQLPPASPPTPRAPAANLRKPGPRQATAGSVRRLEPSDPEVIYAPSRLRRDRPPLSEQELDEAVQFLRDFDRSRNVPASQQGDLPASQRSEPGQTYATTERDLSVFEDVELPGGGVWRRQTSVRRRTTTAAQQTGGTTRPYRHVSRDDVEAHFGRMREAGLDPPTNPQSMMHAEVKQAVSNPNSMIRVDRPMCTSCQKFMSAEAAFRGQSQVVVDPNGAYVFTPDGRVNHFSPEGAMSSYMFLLFE